MSEFVDNFKVNLTKLTFAAASCYIGLLHLEYIDIEYSAWLLWLLAPILVTFILPAVIVVLIYTSAIIYQLRRAPIRLQNWRAAVMAVWDAHGRLWHGYEVVGLEKIPVTGGAMLVFYHGALPIDMYYLTARIYLQTGGNRLVRAVVDRFLYMVPGWRGVLQALRALPGARTACARELRAGELLAVAPGGVYEAQNGDHGYQALWKTRIGFAKVALSTGVPVLPVFTRNVREAFRTASWFLNISPVAPIYGGFPVKLVTYIGDPIYPKISPEKCLSILSLEDIPISEEKSFISFKDLNVHPIQNNIDHNNTNYNANKNEANSIVSRRKNCTPEDKCEESPSDEPPSEVSDASTNSVANNSDPKSEVSETQSEDIALAWDLRKRVEDALDLLIKENQRLPGSIMMGLVDRFFTPQPIMKIKQ